MSFPSLIMDAKMKIINKSFEEKNEIVSTPFVEVESVLFQHIVYNIISIRSRNDDFQ